MADSATGGDGESLADKATEFLKQHAAQIDKGLDKAADALSKATGGKYDHQIDKGIGAAKERLDKLDGDDAGTDSSDPSASDPGSSDLGQDATPEDEAPSDNGRPGSSQ